jgi:hypothetical protein
VQCGANVHAGNIIVSTPDRQRLEQAHGCQRHPAACRLHSDALQLLRRQVSNGILHFLLHMLGEKEIVDGEIGAPGPLPGILELLV